MKVEEILAVTKHSRDQEWMYAEIMSRENPKDPREFVERQYEIINGVAVNLNDRYSKLTIHERKLHFAATMKIIAPNLEEVKRRLENPEYISKNEARLIVTNRLAGAYGAFKGLKIVMDGDPGMYKDAA